MQGELDWFACHRRLLTHALPSHLISCVVEAYLRNGWDSYIADPNAPMPYSDLATTSTDSTPSTATCTGTVAAIWRPISSAFSKPEDVPEFSYGQMIGYFITKTVKDGLPAGDFKGMNKKVMNLFRCGHVQHIEISCEETSLNTRAEMKKDSLYKIKMSLALPACDINMTQCECKTGKGPKASCKHIGALCFAFSEFCSSGHMPGFSCFYQLNTFKTMISIRLLESSIFSSVVC